MHRMYNLIIDLVSSQFKLTAQYLGDDLIETAFQFSSSFILNVSLTDCLLLHMPSG